MNLRPRGAALIVTEPHVIICAISYVPPLIPALVSLPEALLRREALEFFFALLHIFADCSGSHASDKTLRFVRPPWKRCKAGQLRQIPAPVHARMLTSVRRHSLQSHPYTLSWSQQCSHHMRSSVFLPWMRSPWTSPQHTPGTSESGLSSLVTGWRREIIPGAPVFQRWSPWRKVKLVA